MWSKGRLSGRLARVGAFLVVLGVVALAGAPNNKGSSAITIGFGAALLSPALWNAWRGAQVARGHSFGPRRRFQRRSCSS
jgi:drug/metabolite transporter (DMT)-like permease